MKPPPWLPSVFSVGCALGLVASTSGCESVISADFGAYELEATTGEGGGGGGAPTTLGNGTCEPDHDAASDPADCGATSVAVGFGHACAVLGDTTVRCWGWNEEGQLGDGTNTSTSMPVGVVDPATPGALLTGVKKVVAGMVHTCAMRDQDVYCWGDNRDAQLGPNAGPAVTRNVPVFVHTGAGGVLDLAGSFLGNCLVDGTGQVLCWGDNNWAQTGGLTPEDAANLVAVQDVPGALLVATGGTAVPLTTGPGAFSCAILAERFDETDVRCWGANGLSQLGNGSSSEPTPIPLDGPLHAGAKRDIDVGGMHACLLGEFGEVACWGSNHYGQLGQGTASTQWGAVAPLGLGGGTDAQADALCTGIVHNCAVVRGSGEILCWGRNASGELGNGTTGASDCLDETCDFAPTPVVGITGAVDVDCSIVSSCAVIDDGTVQCWGKGEFGALGADVLQSAVPITVSL